MSVTEFLMFVGAITEMYDKYLGKAAEETGLTKPEANILSFFSCNPDFDSPVHAVRYGRYSKSYVSKAMDLLLSKDYIKFKRDTEDRRFIHVEITPRAMPAVKILRETQDKFKGKVISGLTEEEKALVLKVFAKMADNVKE